MSRIKIKSRKVKTRRIKLAITDLPQVADAFFIGDRNRPGWVCIEVNAKGRECIEALFPQAKIAWRDASDMVPADWHGFHINVPDVVAATETKLPLEITKGTNLDEADPDQLAFLLARGVIRQGGRSAIYRDGRLDIYYPQSANN